LVSPALSLISCANSLTFLAVLSSRSKDVGGGLVEGGDLEMVRWSAGVAVGTVVLIVTPMGEERGEESSGVEGVG
jgi:hypothetical protein